jgi:hypothetical protein
MAKKAPAKAPAKRKPRAKKPVEPVVVQLSEDAKARLLESLWNNTHPSKSIAWRSWLISGAEAAAWIVCGTVVGVWVSGGIEVGPGPVPADSVSAVFDAQESAFRSLSRERAKALQSGEIKSEAESAAWMSSRFIPQAEAAWVVLLTEEAKAFGGEQWTAEKEASHIERYSR